jgi:hypothetical protein
MSNGDLELVPIGLLVALVIGGIGLLTVWSNTNVKF